MVNFSSPDPVNFYVTENNFRQARRNQAEKLVKLTVVADEDATLLEEFGTRVMQQGRLARVIEEAYANEALLDGNRLCLLMPSFCRF